MKKINNIWWMIICFIIFLITLVILNPKIITQPYLNLEDGPIFIKDAMNFGIRSFGITYGGYFCTLSRLIAYISVHIGIWTNDVLVLAFFMRFLSTVFAAFVITYFASDEFSNIISSRLLRLIVGILCILLIGNFNFMLYNCVSIHWWCGLLVFLVSINLVNKKIPSTYIWPFFLISIVSTASSMIIFFGLVYFLFSKAKIVDKKFKIKLNKSEIIFIVLTGLFTLIQIYSILFLTDSSNMVSMDLSIDNLFNVFRHTLYSTITSIVSVFGTQSFLQLSVNNLNLFIGCILWMIIIFLSVKFQKFRYVCLGIFCIFSLYFMIFFKNENLVVFFKEIMSTSYQIWYHSLPFTIAFLMCIIILNEFRHLKKEYYAIFICLLLTSLFMFLDNLVTTNFEYTDDLISISKYVDYTSSKVINVPIENDNNRWYIPVPVNPEYCLKNKCDD